MCGEQVAAFGDADRIAVNQQVARRYGITQPSVVVVDGILASSQAARAGLRRDDVLLTVNGKVQAVLVDPVAYQQMQQENNRQRLVAAIREAEQILHEKPKCPIKEVFESIKDKYAL